eukprot:g47189.t1
MALFIFGAHQFHIYGALIICFSCVLGSLSSAQPDCLTNINRRFVAETTAPAPSAAAVKAARMSTEGFDSWSVRCLPLLPPMNVSSSSVHRGELNMNLTNPCKCDFLFGTHHKSGTNFALEFLSKLCNVKRNETSSCLHKTWAAGGMCQPCLATHVNLKDLNQSRGKFVHFIRDPLEWFVSNYQYHLVVTKEKWVWEHQQKLRQFDSREGLLLEWERAKSELEVLTRVYEENPGISSLSTFTVRLEQITFSEISQRRVLQSLQKWLGFPHDKVQFLTTTSPHSTNSSAKPALRTLLLELKGPEIAKYRKRLGYPQNWKEELQRCDG